MEHAMSLEFNRLDALFVLAVSVLASYLTGDVIRHELGSIDGRDATGGVLQYEDSQGLPHG
jgi:hypothetical protein